MATSANSTHGTSVEQSETESSGGVDAVDRALTILRAFDFGRERLSLAALAKETGFYKSTILRITRSLEHGGLLRREADGDFVVGSEALRLAAVYRRTSHLEQKIRPALRRLRDITGESASFYQRVGTKRQCLYREETRRAVRDHVMEGDLLPLDVGAAGTVLTMFHSAKSSAQRDRQMRRLPIVSFGERDAEVAAVAAPVFTYDGLIGALTISGPRSRLTPEYVAGIATTVLGEANSLTKLLGGHIESRAQSTRSAASSVE